MQRLAVVVATGTCLACGGGHRAAPEPFTRYRGGVADVSRAADASMIIVPTGTYVAGSTTEERDLAYDAYAKAAGHDAARRNGWFDVEREPHQGKLPSFVIDLTPVTNAAYGEFVADTGIEPPHLSQRAWKQQGFSQDYATEVARYNWVAGRMPAGRHDHPVVLVRWREAAAYCAWRGALVGIGRRLPSADEYERAARGDDGRAYPWGDRFEPGLLDSAVNGPRDTMPVGSFPDGASPYGMLDAAGNVFQWTSTPWSGSPDEMTIKGSAWDDYAGVGRAASMHGRPRDVRHAIVGFRCAGD